MSVLRKIFVAAIVAAGIVASPAAAADKRIALVVKARGIGFFEAAAKGAEEAAKAFLWNWSENQIAAATKLVPLGQTDAQKTLLKLIPIIETTAQAAFTIPEEHIGNSLPSFAIASSLHEQQYSRLFRS